MQRIDAENAKWQVDRSPVGTLKDSRMDPLPIRLFRYLVPAAVAAGLAIVLTHFVMNQKLQQLQNQANASLDKTNQNLILQTLQLKQLQGEFRSQTQVVELLQSPAVKLVHLKNTQHQPNAVANLLWDQKRQQWAILTTGMTPPAKGQTFELWFVTDKGAFAAGVFDVDEHGTGALAVNIPPNIGQLKTAAVTNEKAGGVAAPAGDFQVAGGVE